MQDERSRPGALNGSPGFRISGAEHVIDRATADELDRLAARIARIKPMCNRNPDAFYEERSEVASEIRSLAMRLRNGRLASDNRG